MISIDTLTMIIITFCVVFFQHIRPIIVPHLAWLKESLLDALFVSVFAVGTYWIANFLGFVCYQFGSYEVVSCFAACVLVGATIDFFKRF